MARRLSETRPIICRQAVDLTISQLYGDGAHSAVNVIATLPGREHFELGGQVFFPLLGKDGCIDRPANAVPMTGAARRNVPVRIADFYQMNDRFWGVRERRWTWIAHRLASIIGGDIGHVSPERLGDIGHELIFTAAGVVVIELFVDRGSGLAGEVWKFWRRGYALLAVAGRAKHPPHAHWPGDARIAFNLNLNVEAGGERCILEGDTSSEHILTDIGFPPYENARSPMVESVFEYGPRVGCWRLLRIFRQFDIKASILGVVRGLQQYPELVNAFVEEGHEIVSHGWRWLDYHHMREREEREHIHLALEGIKALAGAAPVGWFNGRPSINTRRLVIEHGGFLYDRDYLGDELPFWVRHDGRHHLVIPFSFETNDNRFDQNNGFSTADDFATYLNDCFDFLYEEGAEAPKMMTVSL